MVRMNLLDQRMAAVGNMYAWSTTLVLNGRSWISLQVRCAPWLKGTTDGEYQVQLVKGYNLTQFN